MEFLKNIMVFLPVQVVKIYGDSTVDVKPMIYNDIPLPIINRVPIQHLGSSQSNSIKLKVKKGDHGIIFLSQMDLSNYMETGKDSKCETSEAFNLTNAIYCPFLQWVNGGVSSAISDMEIEMPLTTWKGDINLTGNLVVNGNINCTGTVTATVDVVGGGISLKTHTHGGVQTGGGNTGGPI